MKLHNMLVIHRSRTSTVSCSCGFFSRLYTIGDALHRTYADSKAMGVALRHGRREYPDEYRLREEVAR